MPDSRTAQYTTALEFAEQQVATLIHKHPDFFPIYTDGGAGITAGNCGPIGPAGFWPA